MGHSWVSIVGWATLVGSLTLAWWKGSWAERWGAVLLLASNVSSDVAMAATYPATPQLFLFSVDFLLAGGLLALAIRFSSLWLGIAMLLQSLALLEHGLILGGTGLDAYDWMVLNDAISQLMLVCIVVAAIISWRGRTKPPARPAFIIVGDAPVH